MKRTVYILIFWATVNSFGIDSPHAVSVPNFRAQLPPAERPKAQMPAAPPGVSDAEIEKLIQNLADKSFKVRGDAHNRLYAFGERAVPLLKKYENDGDAERRRHVLALMKKPEKIISPLELIQSVRQKLSYSRDPADLLELQSSIQRAYDLSKKELKPLREKIQSGILREQNGFSPTSRDVVDSLIQDGARP